MATGYKKNCGLSKRFSRVLVIRIWEVNGKRTPFGDWMGIMAMAKFCNRSDKKKLNCTGRT